MKTNLQNRTQRHVNELLLLRQISKEFHHLNFVQWPFNERFGLI